MAKGVKYDEAGDFDEARDFGVDPEAYERPLSDYSDENQQYLKDHAQSTVDGNPIDEKERGIFNRVGRDKDGSRQLLKDGEKDASEKPNVRGKGGDKNASLGEKENNVPAADDSTAGKIKNSVQGIKDLKKGNALKAFGSFKKAGPLGAIMAVLLAFAGLSFFGQMAMPFSLIAQFQENFDSISVSQGFRSRMFLRYQMDNNYVRDCRKAHIFSADEFKPSNRMRSRLSQHGITFEEVDGVTVMRHGSDIIVADKTQATDGRKWFDDAFDNDIDFRESYMSGARTWRGSVAAWFDTHMDTFLKKLGINRSYWKDYQRSKKSGSGDSDMEGFRGNVADIADSDTAEGKTRNAASTANEEVITDPDTGQPLVDEDGNTRTRMGATNPEESSASLSRNLVTTNPDGSTNTSALKEKIRGIGDSISSFKHISSVASIGTGVVCGVADFVGAVSAIVAAYQAAQIIKVTAMVFESIQKTQAGEGDAAPLSEVAVSLTQQSPATYTEVLATNDDGEVTDQKVTTRNRSAMEANAIGALYGQTTVDINDPSVKSFNINNTTNKLFGSLAGNGTIRSALTTAGVSAALSVSSFLACTQAKLAAAAVGAATDVAEIAACAAGAVATFGAALVGCIGGAIAEGAAISAVTTTVISVVVSFLTPFVASVLTRKIATEVVGEDLGNALVSGANMYMGQNHQSAGGSIASRDSLVSYYQKQDQIIAENARYERETLSPFDISSKYTFMGSLVSQIAPLVSSSSISGTINNVGSIVGNAFASLTPKSSAISAGIKAQAESDNTQRNCSNIAEIGGVADAFCNPYFITDTSTLETHPADIVDNISDEDLDVDEEGNPVVKEDSNLAKYIIFCGERSSQWGVADQNIMAQVSPTADDAAGTNISNGQVTISPLSTVVGALPVIGDAVDMVDNEKKIKNMGWITGASCVTGYEPTGLEEDTKSWSEEKKYQRFIEDQRLAEAEGLVEQSAVSKFVAQYYEEHPLDNSFEGILARYSGLTKENVIATLDAMEVLSFMSEYEPSSLYPYPASEEKEDEIDLAVNDDKYSRDALLTNSYVSPVRREVFLSA